MHNNCNNIHYYVIFVSVNTEIMLSDIVALYNVVESIHNIEIVRHYNLNKTIYLTCIPLLIFRRTWEIWGNLILGHMRVTLCAIQWKWRLRNYDSVNKLLCMQRSIRLSKKGSSRICHIMIYLRHKITRILLLISFQ
jgi:hypothetical protein